MAKLASVRPAPLRPSTSPAPSSTPAWSFLDLSDRRLKQNIDPIPTSLGQIFHLVPVSYQKKPTPREAVPATGHCRQRPQQNDVAQLRGPHRTHRKAMQDMKAANDNEFTNLKSDNDNLRHELEELPEVVRCGG
jgi:hypothetical protein